MWTMGGGGGGGGKTFTFWNNIKGAAGYRGHGSPRNRKHDDTPLPTHSPADQVMTATCHGPV
jgi:hypothetical protein